MARHHGKKHAGKAWRRPLSGVGVRAGAFVAAAAVAAGSAAPAKADFEDLLDPIVQPILTSLTDSVTLFDPAAALDLTSWTDTFLASLGSFDLALPTADSAVAVAATGAEPAAAAATYTIPITMQIVTEPTIQVTIAGADNTLLVDTGSAGLVIPWEGLGSADLQAFENLLNLGFPTSLGFSGYSGGVDYFYLVYNDVPTVYGDDVLTATGPVDVELFSWSTNLSDPFGNFQDFLDSNHVDGILGIGDNATGPTTSPLESYGGVTVDIPGGNLIVGPNTDTPLFTVDGAPITHLYETVSTSGQTVVGSAVTNNVDSGGVYGTIPSALASHLQTGSVISVYDHQGGTLLYQYTVDIDSIGQSTAPTAVSGTSIDSGVAPFLIQPIYIDYIDHTMSFYGPTS
jgi:PE-PGRS C-terminal aspartyl peptidase-like domain